MENKRYDPLSKSINGSPLANELRLKAQSSIGSSISKFEPISPSSPQAVGGPKKQPNITMWGHDDTL